jgi:hypothetical protein
MLEIRCATPDDDLTALWPETAGHTLNREQVFVAVDGADTLLAGAIMFHGGHSLAYVGSIVFMTLEQQGRIAQRLMAFVKEWGRAHGVTRVGHSAGTPECQEAFQRLGATVTKQTTLMDLTITERADD